MTERESFEKCDKLSKHELNTKTNKNVKNVKTVVKDDVKNDVMSTVIKRFRAEKKEAKEK